MACARDGDVLLFHGLAGGRSDEHSALYAKDAKAAHEAWMVDPAKDAVHVRASLTPSRSRQPSYCPPWRRPVSFTPLD